MKKRIYLSGAMTGLSFEEQLRWRRDLQIALDEFAICFNPPAHFSEHYIDNELTDSSGYKSDREVMNFDLHELRKSDLVIVNFDNGGDKSLGTMAEIAIAHELRIPVLGFGIDKTKLHPWQRDMCERIFNSSTSCVMYLIDHYL